MTGSMKKIYSAAIAVLCAGATFTSFGQEPATIGELTVTSISLRNLADFADAGVTGTDGEKEVLIADLRKGFDAAMSVTAVDVSVDKAGIKVVEGSNVLVVKIEYDGKPYVMTLEAGAKLKYRLVDGRPVIAFDEAYCVYNDVEVEKPADFDPSQYTETTLRQLIAWEKAESGEDGRFKARVYYNEADALLRMMLNAPDSYFFSDMQPGMGTVESIQFKTKQKWATMKEGQKVEIYFEATSKGKNSFAGRILEYVETGDIE